MQQDGNDDRVWVPTTWAHVHPGATVRPPDFPTVVSTAETVIHQQRTLPVPHIIVKTSVRTGQVVNVHDFDPGAPVDMLVSRATARAVALLAAADLAPHVISEHESEIS
jgi:hypothetical protein